MLDVSDSLMELTKAELAALIRDAGFEVGSRMRKGELVEMVRRIEAAQEAPERAESVGSRRITRLRGRLSAPSVIESRDTWHDALEQIVQESIQELSEGLDSNSLFQGIRPLESVVFARSLTGVGVGWQNEGLRLPSELDLFSDPVALIVFRVHERMYRCIKYPPAVRNRSSGREGDGGGFGPKDLERYRSAIESLSEKYSSRTTVLGENPTSPELLAHLFDHLQEETGMIKTDMSESDLRIGEGTSAQIHEVHPARRSAIRDWQSRMEAHCTERYGHEEEGDFFYAYPFIDVLAPDGMHLVLLIVSPLDSNFVDEKVGLDHRCAEICLVVYRLANAAYPVAIDALIPHLKQAFARVLFVSMHKEASLALTSAFDAQSAILRYWVSEASSGYQGIVGESNAGHPFDAWLFCESIIQQILCARIPGVDSEIYPFDRVFVFQETGTTSRFDWDVPVELLVLEASILSNNPADRNQYLTRRERNIRGTEDFECDAGRKVVEADNRYRFYVHGSDKHLIVSPRPILTEEKKQEITRGLPSSLSRRGVEDFLYLMDLPDEEDDRELSSVVQNLFGRLVPGNYAKKEIKDPVDGTLTVAEFKGFKPGFEMRRLAVTERFDENGLYYRYEHGINIAEEIPLLHQLQSSYLAFLDQRLKQQDRRFRREALGQENLPADKIAEILSRYDDKRRLDRKLAAKGDKSSTSGALGGDKAAKVVVISYSWVLNDENTARTLSGDNSGGDDDEAQGALLGPEYRFTMILVSDKDPEKSLSQLNAERENLRLFFKLLMQRIWFDRLAERDFLESRSRTIGHSLSQFIHRAKGLMEDDKRKEEIQNFYDSLRRLIEPQRVRAKLEKVSTSEDIFARLLGNPEDVPASADAIAASLHEQIERWFSDGSDKGNLPEVDVVISSVPMLLIRWPVGVVAEAFYVLLKNACEAASANAVPEPQRIIRIQIQAVPNVSDGQESSWFVDVVMENPGGPIPPARLKSLSAAEPQQLDRNKDKDGSTGIGVYLARYQLQNMIGLGADLLYANLSGDVVQSRLRLPAEQVELTTQFTGDEGWTGAIPEMEGDYVLYVEDTPEVYEKAIEGIRSLLPAGITLEHRTGRNDALALAQAKLPSAVFSDLHIPRDEEGAEAPAKKYGASLLEGLMKIAKDGSYYPPIWIMTSETETDVRAELGTVTASGYRFVVAGTSSPKQLAADGTISVFSTKRPDQVPQFEPFLQVLFGSVSRKEATDSSRAIESQVTPEMRVESLPLKAIDSDGFAKIYSEIQGVATRGSLILRSTCADLSELERDLVRWFKYPGLPDPDATAFQMQTVYRLTEHVWHQGLVLALLLPKQLIGRLPIQFLYWALSKNVWMEDSQSDDQELAEIWRLIRNEDKGPLSLLRHDLKNQWSSRDLEPLLKSTIEQLNICERSIQLSDSDLQALEAVSRSDSISGLSLKDYLRRAGVVASDRAGFRRGIQELDAKLATIPDRNPELQVSARMQRSMLQALDDYLGGS